MAYETQFERAVTVINKGIVEGEEIDRFLSRLVVNHYIRKTLAKEIIDDFVNAGKLMIKENKLYWMK